MNNSRVYNSFALDCKAAHVNQMSPSSTVGTFEIGSDDDGYIDCTKKRFPYTASSLRRVMVVAKSTVLLSTTPIRWVIAAPGLDI